MIFTVTFQLSDESDTSILLLQKEPYIVTTKLLSGNEEFVDENSVIAETKSRRSSFGFDEKKWLELKNSLYKLPPPAEGNVFTLLPHRSYQYEFTDEMDLPRNSRYQYSTRDDINFTLERIKNEMPVYVQYETETWEIDAVVIDG